MMPFSFSAVTMGHTKRRSVACPDRQPSTTGTVYRTARPDRSPSHTSPGRVLRSNRASPSGVAARPRCELAGYVGHGQADRKLAGMAAHQVADGADGGLVDARPAGRTHELGGFPAQHLFPGHGLLVSRNDARHAQHDQEEHDPGHSGNDRASTGLPTVVSNEQDDRGDEGDGAQQGQARTAREQGRHRPALRQLPHRRVEGGGPPAAVEDDPPDIEGVAVVPVPTRVQPARP